MSEMRYRVLGQSGVHVSELCLGTMMFGEQTEENEARRIIDHARERGVNFIDTADQYADGRSEEICGRAIASERDHWVLATKVGSRMPGGPFERGLSRRYICEAVERSLKRLGTDYIDIYYMHRPDPDTRLEHSVRAMGDLVRSGKIRYFGISNFRAWQLTEIVYLCRELGAGEPVILQPYYNLMNRDPEVELIPAARRFGIGVAPYSPIARGILSGKYAPGAAPPAGSRVERGDSRVLNSEWRPESLEIAARLKSHAETRGASLVDYAVAWVLNNAAITSAIVGPRTFGQLESYLGTLDYAWSAEDEALANELVPPGHPSTPGYTDPNFPVLGRFPTKGPGAELPLL